jgi:hypothetical protein
LYIALSFTRLEGESKAHIWQSISLSYTIFKCCLISLQVAFFLSKFKQPNMKIQFKKLVWEQHGLSLLRWKCANVVANFSIETHSANKKYLLYIDAKSAGVFTRDEFKTVDAAKQHAQKWLEDQLTQFIETSENPAQ